MMVTFGTDAHKRSHTVVAVDAAGAEIGSVTVAATPEGHLRLVKWSAQWPQRQWAIEDCRALSRRLESDLLRLGELVVRVPPKLMAGVRRSARTRGKSDPIDALAVARAALREPDLPVAQLDGPSREVRLLVDYRESLVKDRTAAQNRLRWRLHELEPGYDPPAGSLNRYKTLDEIDQLLAAHASMVATLGRREVTRIRELTREASSRTFDRHADAVRWHTEQASRIDQSAFSNPGKVTVAAFLSRWVKGLELKLRPSTTSWYRTHVTNHIEPMIGALRLEALRPDRIEALYAELAARGRSVNTIRAVHKTLRRALDDAMRSGLVVRNAAAVVTPPRTPHSEATERAWTPGQLARFLSQVVGDRLEALWRTAAMTGMRRGEVLGLRWSDLDLPAGQLRVRRALVLIDGVPTMTEPKTEASRRAIDLDPTTVGILREHRKAQLEERLAWGPGYAESEQLVFCREDGTAYRPAYIYHQFRRLSGQLGLPPIPFHGLRHSHATALLVAGVHPRVVQERLGHSSVMVTLDVYSSVIPTMQREAADRLAALIDGAEPAVPLTTR